MRFPSGEEWTDWRPLNSETLAAVPGQPGAYVLSLPAGLPLGRLLHADPHRLLDIGESSNLRRRLDSLRRCATEAGTPGHMAGWRLGTMGLLARLECSAEELRVSWRAARTKEEAYAHEGFILRAYFDLFGELPPLNYKFNWSAFTEVESE
jgi:hypothetical protein